MFLLWFLLTTIFGFLFKIAIWSLILLLLLSVAYYFHLKHRSTYFKRLGLPQPPITSMFLGNLEEFEKNLKTYDKLLEWNEKYGPTFGILSGAHRVIVTSDLNILNEVFVKQFQTFQSRLLHPSFAVDQVHGPQLNVFFSEGNQWKRLRALYSASLTSGKIKSVDPVIKRAAQELIEKFKKDENKVVNVIPDILDFAFAVISRSAMGIDDEFGKSLYLQRVLAILNRGETVKNYLASFFAGTIDFLFITKYLRRILRHPFFFRGFRMRKRIEEGIIKRENETPQEKNTRHQDFLDHLLNAEESDLDIKNRPDLDIKIPKKLTRSELISSAQNFFIAGADTTATLINYCLYELVKNPECEKIILQEIEDYIKIEDDITFNKVKDFKYLDLFVKETARLHPFAYIVMSRRSIRDVTLRRSDGNELLIHKGTCILANNPAMTMDKNIWVSDAKDFNPERFLPENIQNCHPLALSPFGAGPRICPGKNLAIHEVKATLIYLLREFKFEFSDETEINEISHVLMGFETLKLKILPRK